MLRLPIQILFLSAIMHIMQIYYVPIYTEGQSIRKNICPKHFHFIYRYFLI